MSLITNILVPLDFSAPARDALRYACELADAVGASLHVLHAVQTPLMPGGSIELPVPDPWLIERLEEESRSLLDASLTDAQKQTNWKVY